MTAILRLQLDDKDPVRVNSAINQLAEYSDRNQRTKLTAATTFYVSPSGSDSNSGSQTSPFLTMQHAYDILASNVDFGGQTVTVQVANGTYTNGLNVASPWTGGGVLIFQGNTGTPTSCVINTAGVAFQITATLPGALTLDGFQVGGAGTTYGISNLGVGNVVYRRINFAACSSGHVNANGGAAIIISSTNYTISGSAPIHWGCVFGANVLITGSQTVTLTGVPNFSTSFAYADTAGVIFAGGLTFSGTATGTRYQSFNNTVIHTGGGGATYLPGNLPGASGNGGLYL